jgi:hypothetical protein
MSLNGMRGVQERDLRTGSGTFNVDSSDDSLRLTTLRKTLGVLGVYRAKTYVAYRNLKDGSVQEVAVEILDAGAEVPAGIRFQCIAKSAAGKSTSGNPASTVEEALSLVHWDDLD